MAIKINGTNTTASPGITGPDTDTGLVYGTDEVQVVTGGTTRATVDSSGNITTTGSATFASSVQAGGARGVDAAGNSFESYGLCRVARPSTQASPGNASVYEGWLGTTVKSNIFADGSATFAGDVTLTEGRVKATRATAGTAGVFSGFLGSTLTSEILANGSAQFSGSVSIGGTAAANTIDEYEEGTWTPTVTNGASAVTVDAGNCIYVKVGSLVTCHFEIYDITSPNNNPLDFGGLPYAPDNEGTFPLMSNSVDFPAGRTMLTGYLHPSKWRVYASGNNAGWLALTGNNMSTNGSFIGVISYRST